MKFETSAFEEYMKKREGVECMFDIERSLELSIGTRFCFWDSIYEVAELDEGEE